MLCELISTARLCAGLILGSISLARLLMVHIITNVFHRDMPVTLVFPGRSFELARSGVRSSRTRASFCAEILHVMFSLTHTNTSTAWEGPVFLAQYLAVSEKSIAAASLFCPSGITLGLITLLLGPVAFLILAARKISRHIKDGRMAFNYNATPSWTGLKRAVSKGRGLFGKLLLAHAYWQETQERGSWDDSESLSHWGFLMSG